MRRPPAADRAQHAQTRHSGSRDKKLFSVPLVLCGQLISCLGLLGVCHLRTLFSMALKDGLLAEFDHEIATTRKLLERLPDDKLSWRPHAKSMSLGGLGTHLGNIPQWAS